MGFLMILKYCFPTTLSASSQIIASDYEKMMTIGLDSIPYIQTNQQPLTGHIHKKCIAPQPSQTYKYSNFHISFFHLFRQIFKITNYQLGNMNAKNSTSRTSPNSKFYTTSKKQNELCRRTHAPNSPLLRRSSRSQESSGIKISASLVLTRVLMAPIVMDMMSAEMQQMLAVLQLNDQTTREFSTVFFSAMIFVLPLEISAEGREQIKSLLRLVGDENLALIAGIRFSGPPYSDYIVSEYGVAINLVGFNTVGPTTTLFKTIKKVDGSLAKKRFEDHAGYTADIHELVEQSHPARCRACSRQEVYNMFSDARLLDSFSVMAKRVLDGCVEEGKGGPSGRHVLAIVDCVMEAYHDEYEPWLPFESRSGSAEMA